MAHRPCATMAAMRVLVTGASGFLGSRVVHQLRSLGHDATVLLRATSDRSRLAGLDHAVAIGDVTDAPSVLRAVEGVDAVIHTAGRADMGGDPADLERVNVDGTRHVFEAAVEVGVPVVHVSSVTALGPTGTTPEDETFWSTEEPVTAYQRTKRDGHLLAREYRAAGADIRVGSPGGVYGPGDNSALGRMIRLYMTVPMPVVAFRDAIQSTVQVDDCADGLVRILEDGAPGDEYLLVAETVTMREWIDAMMRAADRPLPFRYVADASVARVSSYGAWLLHAIGGPHEVLREYVATAVRNWAYSGDKARRELGWNPRPLEVGLRQVAADLPARRLLGRR
jgi:nucleoside-diphosphate-sugar epimerase